MSVNHHFLKFYENIKLTSSQKEDAIKKHTGVCKKLHDYYYPDIDFSGNTRLLIGSYGKHTHIRPARDIDVIFVMPPDKFDQYDDNQTNGQSQLLQDIKRILKEKYPDTPIKAFGKVVVLEFADTKHNVELLPAWENNDATFVIPNSEDGGHWEQWDPRSEIKRIGDSDSETGKTRSLVRMIKKWSETCTVNLKSYKIENNVLSYFDYDDHSGKDYPILVRDFFDYFHKKTSNEKIKSHIATALNRSKKACDLESDSKLDEAIDEWRKIFGDDFPKSTSKSDVRDKVEVLQKEYPAPKEEFLDTNYNIPFRIDPKYKVKIDATVTQDGFRPGWLSEFLRKQFRLKKSKKLLFSIVQKTVPYNYSVKWKVRNFGEEAKKANDLRGEITDDRGSETKEERTKYYGEHYVECYIIENNKCVAMDKILVPIGSEY